MISPVPSSTTKICRFGVVEVREKAFAFFQVISIEAFSAVSIHSMSFALVRDGHADVIGIEGPIFGADQALLIVPVPGSTSEVGGLGIVEVGEDTFAFLEVVSLEAFSAVSVHSVGFTLIRDGHADVIGIEDPIFRAGQTLLIVPIPGSTSNI